MKNLLRACFGLFLFHAGLALSQDATLGSAVGVIVFPADGQDAAEQSRDEASCYRWATDNTGSDPFDLEKRAAQQTASAERAAGAAQQAGQGAAVGGAAAGAVTGAVVGRIFGSKSTSRDMARAG
ncbi:MAG: hypothetical protein ACWGPN_13980, partial [Gammaproteobacteria bacterium]